MDQRSATEIFPPRVPLANKPLRFFKSLSIARQNLLEIIPEIALKQPIVSGRTGVRWHMVMDPGALKIILKDRLENYPKSDTTKHILKPAIGNSLFIAEGSEWRWQRRAASPVFQLRNIDNLAPVMSQAVADCVERLAAQETPVADMYGETVRMTVEVIANVTFSSGNALSPEVVGTAVGQYIEQIARLSFLDMIGAPEWVPRPSRIFGPGSLTQVKDIANKAIRLRQTHGAKEVPDLLDLLMSGKDTETGRTMNNAELRDNVLAFITAGHETTALSLAWALYLCAFDQTVQNRAREEAQAVLKGDIAQARHIPELTYTRQVINETLRLYPPAAFLGRTAQSNDELCGREIRKKDTIMLPIYALHRHQDLWENPDRFDPDRFVDERKIDRYAYLPFGAGPRICIGAEFAMRESQIILATLLSRFKFELTDRPPPVPKLLMTLRPSGGVHLKITKL